MPGVPNTLEVKLPGELAVEICNSLGYAAIGGKLDPDRALVNELRVIDFINKALISVGEEPIELRRN